MSEKYTHCPGCGRHCPVDSLSCERGRKIIAANNDTTDNEGFRKLYDSIHEAEQAENMDVHKKHGCGNSMHGRCGHREDRCAHHRDHGHDGIHCAHHCGPEHAGMHCDHHDGPRHGAHRKGCLGRGPHHAEPDENSPIEQKLLFKLHKCVHYLHSGAHGRAGQERIISMLNEHGTMTQRELTELAGVRSASISEVLSKLEHRGMIERTKNEDDRRNIDVRLTDSGKNALNAHGQRMSDKELFECLSEEELNSLLSILDKLISHWSNNE